MKNETWSSNSIMDGIYNDIISHVSETETFKRVLMPSKDVGYPSYKPIPSEWDVTLKTYLEPRLTIYDVLNRPRTAMEIQNNEFEAVTTISRFYVGTWPKPGGIVRYKVTIYGKFEIDVIKTKIITIWTTHENVNILGPEY